MDSVLVPNPQDVSQQFNEFFVNSIYRLIYLNKNYKIDHATKNDAIQNPNVLFLGRVIEESVIQVTSTLKLQWVLMRLQI
jgi:hypothetical protein